MLTFLWLKKQPYYTEYFNNFATNAPEGVTVTSNNADDVFEVSVTIDLKNADLQELMKGGYLIGTSEDADKAQAISFSQTCAGLEAAGYVLQAE